MTYNQGFMPVLHKICLSRPVGPTISERSAQSVNPDEVYFITFCCLLEVKPLHSMRSALDCLMVQM